MFRSRRWLLCATLFSATLGFDVRLGATPPLTTIQDTLFNSDGSRFNGVITISWQTFEASDGSDIAASSIRLQIVNGLLYVQLVPSTTAITPTVYTVQYSNGGASVYTEAWAVSASSTALTVANVRLAPGTVTGAGSPPVTPPTSSPSSGGSTPPAQTTLGISDITGLQTALTVRPVEGASFAVGRAAVIDSTGALDGAQGNLGDCLHVDGTSGPCGSTGGTSGTGTFVDAEIPSGAINGSNTSFALANIPAPVASLELFRNGLLLQSGNDYTISGNSITFLSGTAPQSSDILIASYRMSVTITGVGFVDLETPAGAANGNNTSFTLAQTPSPLSSVAVFRNGMRLASGLDYTIISNTLTFAAGAVPQSGDVILCSYRVAQ